MAGVLHLLKDRGELTQRMQWAGRTNDMKPVMLQGLEDVYQSGAHSDEIANRVELALTRRDEYGRVLTPKQAFREVSYRCVCVGGVCACVCVCVCVCGGGGPASHFVRALPSII